MAVDLSSVTLPATLDPALYRRNYSDLAHMSDSDALAHYAAFGMDEGRVCGVVDCRQTFLTLIPRDARILEIGPSWAPAFHRPFHDVRYLDAYDTAELRRRAALDANSAGQVVPVIDYVWTGQPYRALVDGEFDVVFSSHNIEHQPDLIAHLRDLEDVLRPGGLVALVIPDKRFCFDHFLPESTVADAAEAHAQRRTRHAAAKVLADRMMHAHNDPARHWRGDHGEDPRFGPPSGYRTDCLRDALRQDAESGYRDAHAWQFTPATFHAIVTELRVAGLTGLEAARVYPTLSGSFEFYAMLRKP